MITNYVNGDLLLTEIPNIAHGVNCQGAMGSGVAKAIYLKYPSVRYLYIDYHNSLTQQGLTDVDFLGDVQVINLLGGKKVFNMFTQRNFGSDGFRYVNYAAVAQCFKTLCDILPKGSKVAIPKIGAGLAGGDWEILSRIINDAVGDSLDITVYCI